MEDVLLLGGEKRRPIDVDAGTKGNCTARKWDVLLLSRCLAADEEAAVSLGDDEARVPRVRNDRSGVPRRMGLDRARQKRQQCKAQADPSISIH